MVEYEIEHLSKDSKKLNMSKSLDDLEFEYTKARSAYLKAQEEAANNKYGSIVGKWIEVSSMPWHEDEEVYKEYALDYTMLFVLVEKLVHVTPMSSTVDCVHVIPKYCAEVLPGCGHAFLWKTGNMVEEFYSNRYKVVDAEYVAEELKKVTLKQIELTNKIIKTIS